DAPGLAAQRPTCHRRCALSSQTAVGQTVRLTLAKNSRQGSGVARPLPRIFRRTLTSAAPGRISGRAFFVELLRLLRFGWIEQKGRTAVRPYFKFCCAGRNGRDKKKAHPGWGALWVTTWKRTGSGGGAAGEGDYLGEGAGVADGQVGQGLAVEGDIGLVQAVDQPAVGEAVEPGAGVDAGNPQAAQVAPAVAAVAVGVPQAVEHRL